MSIIDAWLFLFERQFSTNFDCVYVIGIPKETYCFLETHTNNIINILFISKQSKLSMIWVQIFSIFFSKIQLKRL